MKPLFHFLPLAHVSRTSGSTKMPTIDSTSKTQISPIKKSYTIFLISPPHQYLFQQIDCRYLYLLPSDNLQYMDMASCYLSLEYRTPQ